MINTLKIGTVVYSIEAIDRLHVVDNSGVRFLNGQVEYHPCRIRIDDDLPEHLRPVTVLHEAIHAVIEQAGITDQDERLVLALGYGIAELIRDNPHFIEWLMKAATPQSVANEPTTPPAVNMESFTKG